MVVMTAQDASSYDINHWDLLLSRNPDGGNVFQTAEMAEAKRKNGWTPRYLLVDGIAVTALEKSVIGHGAFWYLPKGPGVTTTKELTGCLPSLRACAVQHGVFVVKLEPEIIETDEARAELKQAGLVRTHAIQPNSSTVLVDLSPPLEDIMMVFNQKGRNAIRRAERDGVTTRAVEANDDNMRTMFALLSETALGRFDDSLRSFDYYKEFWHRFIDAGHGSLFFAEFEGRVVAAAFCIYSDKKGLYKDGASLRKKMTYGASHLLQWEVMRWMKDHGVMTYDLCGTPHSSDIHNEHNPFYGIGHFKTQFNKKVTDYVGCYDLVIQPASYARWRRIGERMTLSLSWRLKHRQWY